MLFIRRVRMFGFNYGLKGGQDLGRSGDGGNIQHEVTLGSGPSLVTCCPSFISRDKYGMMALVTQTLKLEDTPKINSRFFDEGKTLYPHVFQGWGICPTWSTCHSLALCWGPGNIF